MPDPVIARVDQEILRGKLQSNDYNNLEFDNSHAIDPDHIANKNTDEALAKLNALRTTVSAIENFAQRNSKEEAAAHFLESLGDIHGLIGELEALIEASGRGQDAADQCIRSSVIGETPDLAHGSHETNHSILPPMPTHADLAASGDLYRTPGMAAKSRTIIEHLDRVWGPWIKAGVLTRKELLHRDISAYRALTKWTMKPENNLVEALGADIPTVKAVTDKAAEGYAPGERPARLEWALLARAQRAAKRE